MASDDSGSPALDSILRLMRVIVVSGAVAFLSVILVVLGFWNWQRTQHNKDARDTVERRESFCRSLDDFGTIGTAGLNGVLDMFKGDPRAATFTPQAEAANQAAVDAAVVMIRAHNGFPQDCVLPPAPQQGVPIWLPAGGIAIAVATVGGAVLARRRVNVGSEYATMEHRLDELP